MWTFSESTDIMAEPEPLFQIVGNLMTRGHYWPGSVIGIRETAPRPFSPSEKFLPGQRISFIQDGNPREHTITEGVEWDQAEALIVEKPLRSTRDEKIEWKLSELTLGTIRVTVNFSGNYTAIEKLTAGKAIKKFYQETLERLKAYAEDRYTYAGPRTYAPAPVQADPLQQL